MACDDPKCHEQITTELMKKVSWEGMRDVTDKLAEKVDALKDKIDEKMPKSWTKTWWFLFGCLGIPVLGAALCVWAGQNSDSLRYAKIEVVSSLESRMDLLEAEGEHTKADIREIKDDIGKMVKMMKDDEKSVAVMLKMMRDEWKRNVILKQPSMQGVQ